MEVNGCQQLFLFPLNVFQNIFSIQQKKETHKGLYQLDGE